MTIGKDDGALVVSCAASVPIARCNSWAACSSDSGVETARIERPKRTVMTRRAEAAAAYEDGMTLNEWDMDVTAEQLTPTTWPEVKRLAATRANPHMHMLISWPSRVRVQVLRRAFLFGPLAIELRSIVSPAALAAAERLGCVEYGHLDVADRVHLLRGLVDAATSTVRAHPAVPRCAHTCVTFGTRVRTCAGRISCTHGCQGGRHGCRYEGEGRHRCARRRGGAYRVQCARAQAVPCLGLNMFATAQACS